MKNTSLVITAYFLIHFTGCKTGPDPPIPQNPSMPYFNQVNTTFETDQIQCLLDQWYGKVYQNEPIVLRVINDIATYNSFFSCKAGVDLPAIDFAENSLIIGMKADYGELTNTPVNIKKIEQHLAPTSNGQYLLTVTVAGKKTENNKGGEWFAFTSVVPKIQGKVDLEMKYEFE